MGRGHAELLACHEVTVESGVCGDEARHPPVEARRADDGRREAECSVVRRTAAPTLVDRQPLAAPELAAVEPRDVHLAQVGRERRELVKDERCVVARNPRRS
jgi:hypothetical protein